MRSTASEYSIRAARPPRFLAESSPMRERLERREPMVPTLTHNEIRFGVVRVSRGKSVWAEWMRVLLGDELLGLQ